MNERINVDGVEYERVQTDGECLCIVIVDNRGLTFLGRMNPVLASDGGYETIRDARCIIWWGTKHEGASSGHLAQLANDGPAESTRLGARRSVRVNRRNIIAIYICNEKAWVGHD